MRENYRKKGRKIKRKKKDERKSGKVAEAKRRNREREAKRGKEEKVKEILKGGWMRGKINKRKKAN